MNFTETCKTLYTKDLRTDGQMLYLPVYMAGLL